MHFRNQELRTKLVSQLFGLQGNTIEPETGSLMEQDSIIDVLEREIRERGFVGSADVPKLVFLASYTRFFDRPVSMVIKGSSGSGKSYGLKAGLQFIPKDAYELFAGMSEKALIYNPDLDLKHKHLVIQEAAGLNEGTGRTFLRQLLSEGEARYATVQSTKDGLVGEDLPLIEGPCGLLMTTTANALHPEDESRMLSYHLEEDPQKMREALIAQAMLQGRPPKPIDTKRWFELDQYVRDHDKTVHVPFLETLARRLPTTHNRIMRDFPHVISLIQAHALVHQCGRERSEEGAVIATLDDYAAVHALIAKPLSEGLDAAVPQNVREVVEAAQILLAEQEGQKEGGYEVPFDPDRGVSQKQIADVLKRERSVVSRNVSSAIEQGFLVDLNPGQGRIARLVLGESELPSGSALPAPEKIDEPDLPSEAMAYA